MSCASIRAPWSRRVSLAFLLVAGCAGEVTYVPPGPDAGATSGTASTAGSGGATSAVSVVSAVSTGTGGIDTDGGPAPMTGSIEEVNTGVIGSNVTVQLVGVVAMSRKLLVAYSKSTGSCLWGAFLSDPGLPETAPFTGILATSYGAPAILPPGGGTAHCPALGVDPTGDAFPDDLAPGDVLDVTGETSTLISSSCTQPGDCAVPSRQIAGVTKAIKSGTVTPPAPHALTGAELTQLADPCDPTFVDRWRSTEVRIQNVTGAVGSGDIVLEGSGLHIGGPFASPSTSYADPTVAFTQIDGFSVVDFCSSKVDPLNRCVDLQPPPSSGCP